MVPILWVQIKPSSTAFNHKPSTNRSARCGVMHRDLGKTAELQELSRGLCHPQLYKSRKGLHQDPEAHLTPGDSPVLPELTKTDRSCPKCQLIRFLVFFKWEQPAAVPWRYFCSPGSHQRTRATDQCEPAWHCAATPCSPVPRRLRWTSGLCHSLLRQVLPGGKVGSEWQISFWEGRKAWHLYNSKTWNTLPPFFSYSAEINMHLSCGALSLSRSTTGQPGYQDNRFRTSLKGMLIVIIRNTEVRNNWEY